MPAPVVVVWTDGSAGLPGEPGGWAVVIRYGRQHKTITGAVPATNSNRMELTAVLEACRAFKERCVLRIHTDSAHVATPISAGWINRWKQRGWNDVPARYRNNLDLWKAIYEETRRHAAIKIVKVKGHDKEKRYPDNDRADMLAKEARLAMLDGELLRGVG